VCPAGGFGNGATRRSKRPSDRSGGLGRSDHPGHDGPVGGWEGCRQLAIRRRAMQSESNVIGSYAYALGVYCFVPVVW